MDEPVVGVRTIKDLTDFWEFFNTDVYKRGMYKGKTHSLKAIIRKTPGIRSIYEFPFAKDKNNYIKSMVLESRIYDYLSDNEDESLSIMEQLSLIFRDRDAIDEEEAWLVYDSLENTYLD